MDEESIFLEALQKPAPAERLAFVEQACAGDAELRRSIELLLKAHDKAVGFLDPDPGLTAADPQPADEAPGAVIGPYRLLEQIGEGGFGVVFMAEQQQPIRRKVALKVLKPGMDTRQVIARFEVERQALALMDHGNIARVLDGGETAGGRPYFVMELVKGVPITEYCDQEQLAPRQRLDLFIHVCQAVQHAHQKGIIHRDIKPSNVLVTLRDGEPVPKVIDFGIAKATGQQLTEKTLFTNFAQMVGTPLYMSPEQAALSGLDVDTRSDLYSLGVLLYELLTGTTPFDKERFREVGYDEMRRIIREEEPPRPSTRISTLGQAGTTLSSQRKSDPQRLSRLFRGELDWIVMKCLEKDRERRYQTANSLAQDVERYLHDEPVLACPPSPLYRFRKFARRHRAALLTTSLVAVTLVAGAVVSGWLAVRATRAETLARTRMQAEQEAREAEGKRREQARAALDAMTSLMLEDLLARQPALTEEHKKFLRQALQAYEEFARDTQEDEASRYGVARALSNVGLIRRRLSLSPEALAAYQDALQHYAQLAADFPGNVQYQGDLTQAHQDVGTVLSDLGRMEECFDAFTKALTIGDRVIAEFPGTPKHQQAQAECYLELAAYLPSRGRSKESETAIQKAIALLEPLVAESPQARAPRSSLARCQAVLSGLAAGRGDSVGAVAASRKAINLLEPLVAQSFDKQDRLLLGQAYNSLANRLKDAGPPEEIEKAYRSAVGSLRQLANDFPTTAKFRLDLAICLMNWAVYLNETKRQVEAETHFRDALVLARRLAEDYPAITEHRTILATAQSNLGKCLQETKRFPEAEACWNEALAIRKTLVAQAPANPTFQNSLAVTLVNLAELRIAQKQFQAACDLLHEALPHHEAALKTAPRNPAYRSYYANNRHHLAACLLELADHVGAAAATEQCVPFTVHPVTSYHAATFLSRCTILAQQDNQLAPEQRRQQSELYAKRAMELLHQAVKNGYKDGEHMRKDVSLDALRARKDFKELLAQLETAAKPREK